jgi:hypothetical protein
MNGRSGRQVEDFQGKGKRLPRLWNSLPGIFEVLYRMMYLTPFRVANSTILAVAPAWAITLPLAPKTPFPAGNSTRQVPPLVERTDAWVILAGNYVYDRYSTQNFVEYNELIIN